MLVHLKKLLDKRGIPTRFDPVNDRIHCYAHVIDLGCKAVVNNWPDNKELEEYDKDKIRNPVALASEVVRSIRGSGARRERFAEVIETGNAKGYFEVGGKVVQLEERQLLRYVRTRWDSCYLMLSRLREMRPVSCHPGSRLCLRLNFHSTGGRLLPRAPK